jgi:hypothetical protein
MCRPPVLLQLIATALFLVPGVLAQQHSYEHTFHASKADVDLALRTMHADSGARLPMLEGFVAAISDSVRYRRPFYQYSVQVTAISPSETLLRVTANITAWYEDENPSNSAYRALASNGRLESDLCDRVEEALREKTAAQPAPAAGASLHAGSGNVPPNASATLPDAASAAKTSSLFKNPAVVPPPVSSKDVSAPGAQDSTVAKRIQQLQAQAKTLDDVVRNQSKPDDLAVVRQAHTPVRSRPMPEAKVLMLADAEDEFQVLQAENDWVHVQLTGLMRGWVRREQLDLSGVSSRLLAKQNSSPVSTADLFQQTREETATFPGEWQPLRGKKVRIIWIQPNQEKQSSGLSQRASFARSVFRKSYPELSRSSDKIEGVVIVFDAADGGMAAATVADLRRLNTGELSDIAFWKQCWLDPPEAFTKPPGR